MTRNTEIPSHLWADFGPVSMDTTRLHQEIAGFGVILLFLLLLRLGFKLISRL